VSVSVGRFLAALGIVYAWLLASLSLFDETRHYTERLTGLVVSPLSSLVVRLAAALPVFVVVLVAGLLVAALVRLSDLFFAAVSRGEASSSWVSPESARFAGLMARGAIVMSALIFAGPVITGESEGSLARVSFVALGALALAIVPLLSAALVGFAASHSGGLRVGDVVQIGRDRGVVADIRASALVLTSEHGIIRVPYLRLLWHSVHIVERARP
jgi:small-conductance mechanosensitive channel